MCIARRAAPEVNREIKSNRLDAGRRSRFGPAHFKAGELIVDGPATGARNSRATGSIPTPAFISYISRSKFLVNSVDKKINLQSQAQRFRTKRNSSQRFRYCEGEKTLGEKQPDRIASSTIPIA